MKPIIGKLDRYIIKKFLGTFFFSILLMVSIAIVFDLSENMDDFLDNEVSVNEMIFDYYINWIPYFANLFSSLFIFIAVIFFTSKMAYNSEIIAILAGGVSFKRFMRPYFIGALIIGSLSWSLSNFVIPETSVQRIDFLYKYIKKGRVKKSVDAVHMQIEPGVFMYVSRYSPATNVGHKFTLERFEDDKLVSKLVADYVKWLPEDETWEIRGWYNRNLEGDEEVITSGLKVDTVLNISPANFTERADVSETLNVLALNEYIEQLHMRGEARVTEFEIENYKRLAYPFSTFILTIIGACIGSKKVRGGTGLHVFLGLIIGAMYLMFMQFSTIFATAGSMDPMLAVWLPNIFFGVVAIFVYRGYSR